MKFNFLSNIKNSFKDISESYYIFSTDIEDKIDFMTPITNIQMSDESMCLSGNEKSGPFSYHIL